MSSEVGEDVCNDPTSHLHGPFSSWERDPSSVQEDSKYSAKSVLISPRLPDLFCLRPHLWAMDSSLSSSQGFTLIDSSMSVSVHSVPLFSKQGLCPLLPALLPSALPHCACLESWHSLLAAWRSLPDLILFPA